MRVVRDPSREFRDEIVAVSAAACFSHTPAFSDMCVAAVPGFSDASVGFVFDDGARAFVPMLARPETLGWHRAFESTFRAYGGVVSSAPLGASRLNEIAAALASECRRRRFTRLTIVENPRAGERLDLNAGRSESHTAQEATTSIIDLAPGAGALASRFSESRRRNIRQAERAGVVAAVAESSSDFDAFHAVYQDRVRRWGAAAKTRFNASFFRAVFDASRHDSRVRLWVARQGSDVLAGAVVLYHGTHAQYWIGASVEEDRHHANAFLHAAIMTRAAADGLSVYDMGRSGRETLRDFKARYGAEERPYRIQQLLRLPAVRATEGAGRIRRVIGRLWARPAF